VNCPDLRIQVRSEPRFLKCIRELLRSYVVNSGFSRDQAESVALAVDEACSNSIRHSYGGSCDEFFEISLRSDPAGLEIVVTDQGRPAPPGEIARRKADPTAPEEVKPGGLGLRLISEVFDEVDFRPGQERGNRVIMRLKRKSEG